MSENPSPDMSKEKWICEFDETGGFDGMSAAYVIQVKDPRLRFGIVTTVDVADVAGVVGDDLSKENEVAKEYARLITVAPEMLEALRQIAKGEGPFSVDPLIHAGNTIDAIKEIASTMLTEVKGED